MQFPCWQGKVDVNALAPSETWIHTDQQYAYMYLLDIEIAKADTGVNSKPKMNSCSVGKNRQQTTNDFND